MSVEDVVASAAAGLDSAAGADPGTETVAADPGSDPVAAETTETATAVADPTVPAPAAVADPNAPPVDPAAAVVPDKAARRNPIPLDRHEAIVGKHKAEIDTLTQRLSQYETPDVQAKLRSFDVYESDPPRFAQVMFEDARLGPIFRQLAGAAAPAAATGGQPAQPYATPTGQVPAERPGPDTLLPDGNVGYTAAAMEQLVAFETKQVEDRLNKALEERFGPVKPLLEERQAQVAWDSATKAQKEVLDRHRAGLPQFREHEIEMRDWMREQMQAGKRVTPLDAYGAIVVPKFQTSRDAMRTELLAELNKKPAAVIPAPTNGAPVNAPSGGAEGIVAAVARRLEAQGAR